MVLRAIQIAVANIQGQLNICNLFLEPDRPLYLVLKIIQIAVDCSQLLKTS